MISISTRYIISSIVALQACLLLTGAPRQQREKEQPLARLSYMSTYVDDSGSSPYSPTICFEVSKSGRYRVSKNLQGRKQNLMGTLSTAQFETINKMLMELDFSAKERGMLVMKGSESFVAEVATGDKTNFIAWTNPDRQRPFPAAVRKIVEWLQEFAPKDGSPIKVPELSTNPICPRTSDKPLQPVE